MKILLNYMFRFGIKFFLKIAYLSNIIIEKLGEILRKCWSISSFQYYQLLGKGRLLENGDAIMAYTKPCLAIIFWLQRALVFGVIYVEHMI